MQLTFLTKFFLREYNYGLIKRSNNAQYYVYNANFSVKNSIHLL